MISRQKGAVILIVLSLIFLLLILGSAVLMISRGHFGTSFHQINRARAFYAAEAGLQHALWKCRSGGYNLVAGDSETITVQDPNYTQNVTITIGLPDGNGLNSISAEVDFDY